MRAGFIIPSVNTVLEDELRRHFPAGLGYSLARVPLRGGATVADDLRLLPERAAAEAVKLADAGVVVVAVACMAASVAGESADADLARTVGAAGGVDVITAGGSALAALYELGARRVEVITPYQPWLHEWECSFFTRAGLDVVDIRLGHRSPDSLAMVPPSSLARDIFYSAAAPGLVDATVFSCANAAIITELPSLSEALGRPVLSTNQMIARSVLTFLGVDSAGTDFETKVGA